VRARVFCQIYIQLFKKGQKKCPILKSELEIWKKIQNIALRGISLNYPEIYIIFNLKKLIYKIEKDLTAIILTIYEYTRHYNNESDIHLYRWQLL
jgi:hypothetical protein